MDAGISVINKITYVEGTSHIYRCLLIIKKNGFYIMLFGLLFFYILIDFVTDLVPGRDDTAGLAPMGGQRAAMR